MRHVVHMHNAAQGHQALLRLWEVVKPWLVAGHKLRVTAEQERRNLDQNAKLHAICSDLERSKIPWAGKPRDRDQWKVLLVSGHAVATKESAEIVPGLEGEFLNIRESAATMTKARCSSLIEYALAFCATHGVIVNQGDGND